MRGRVILFLSLLAIWMIPAGAVHHLNSSTKIETLTIPGDDSTCESDDYSDDEFYDSDDLLLHPTPHGRDITIYHVDPNRIILKALRCAEKRGQSAGDLVMNALAQIPDSHLNIPGIPSTSTSSKNGSKQDNKPPSRPTPEPKPITKATTPKITTKASTPKITIKATTPKITTKPSTPKITIKTTTPKITTKPSTPKITTKATTPKITTKPKPPKITTKPKPPKITIKTTTPRITTKATAPKSRTVNPSTFKHTKPKTNPTPKSSSGRRDTAGSSSKRKY